MSHNSGNARRILLDGVFNCRDLGGYPCAGGKTTQFGRFIRCGIPFGPMGPDRARLAEIPVKTVIDLRGNGESKVAPSAYAKEPDIVYHHYIDEIQNWEFSTELLDSNISSYYGRRCRSQR